MAKFVYSGKIKDGDRSEVRRAIKKDLEEIRDLINRSPKRRTKIKKGEIAKNFHDSNYSKCFNCSKYFHHLRQKQKVVVGYIPKKIKGVNYRSVFKYKKEVELLDFLKELMASYKHYRKPDYDEITWALKQKMGQQHFDHLQEKTIYYYIMKESFCSQKCKSLTLLFTYLYNKCLECRSYKKPASLGEKCLYQTVYRNLKPIRFSYNSTITQKMPSLYEGLRLLISRGKYKCPGFKFSNNFQCEGCKEILRIALNASQIGTFLPGGVNSTGKKIQKNIFNFKDDIERFHPLTL